MSVTRVPVGETEVTNCSPTSEAPWRAWLHRREGDDSTDLPTELEPRIEHVNEQFLRDVPIWSNVRYTPNRKLTASEVPSFRALRRWVQRFYPDGQEVEDSARQRATTDMASGSRAGAR
jgi:3-Ketosteroid 9alpha-hydroxylase C-terminal domain